MARAASNIFLDHNAKQVTSMIFDEAEDFEQEMAKIMLRGKNGYINRAGKEIIAARYDELKKFSSVGPQRRLRVNGGL